MRHAGRIAGAGGKRFVVACERGELLVQLQRPAGQDHQMSHTRDECHVALDGAGTLPMGGEPVPFKPGDFLFVPADVEHRLESFGGRISAWVVFHGPEGGARI